MGLRFSIGFFVQARLRSHQFLFRGGSVGLVEKEDRKTKTIETDHPPGPFDAFSANRRQCVAVTCRGRGETLTHSLSEWSRGGKACDTATASRILMAVRLPMPQFLGGMWLLPLEPCGDYFLMNAKREVVCHPRAAPCIIVALFSGGLVSLTLSWRDQRLATFSPEAARGASAPQIAQRPFET